LSSARADSTPEQVIPLLNDYANVIVSAIHAQSGDVLKLIGDGILAIFTAADRAHACAAALAAATSARGEVAALKARRDSMKVHARLTTCRQSGSRYLY
jgi:class 3 adenylate cyclase